MWRQRKAKYWSDPAYRQQQLDADGERRWAAGGRRRLPPGTPCSEPGCDREHDSLGLCTKHYHQRRRREGKIVDVRVPRINLHAVCSRPGFPTKDKVLTCAVPVGIIPGCPMCGMSMVHVHGGHIFHCPTCTVRAEFNAEEVSWLATSAGRSTLQSRRTSSSSAA